MCHHTLRCMRTHTHTHTHTHAHTCTHAHTHPHTHPHTHTCTHTHAHPCVHTYIYTHIACNCFAGNTLNHQDKECTQLPQQIPPSKIYIYHIAVFSFSIFLFFTIILKAVLHAQCIFFLKDKKVMG